MQSSRDSCRDILAPQAIASTEGKNEMGAPSYDTLRAAASALLRERDQLTGELRRVQEEYREAVRERQAARVAKLDAQRSEIREKVLNCCAKLDEHYQFVRTAFDEQWHGEMREAEKACLVHREKIGALERELAAERQTLAIEERRAAPTFDRLARERRGFESWLLDQQIQTADLVRRVCE